jgi:hypothetical protein
MSQTRCKSSVAVGMLVSVAVHLGVASSAWGSFSGLVAHPVRGSPFFVMLLAAAAAALSGSNVTRGKRFRLRGRWTFVPMAGPFGAIRHEPFLIHLFQSAHLKCVAE